MPKRALAATMDELGAVCPATGAVGIANQDQTSVATVDPALEIMALAHQAGRAVQATISVAFGCPFEARSILSSSWPWRRAWPRAARARSPWPTPSASPPPSRFADHLSRGANQPELGDLIGVWTGKHTVAEAETAMLAASVPAGRLYAPADMMSDPHVAARETIVPVEHPRWPNLHMQGVVPKLSETPGAARRIAPRP